MTVSESDVTCGKVWLPILGICALHLTHSCSAHSPAVNTHTHTLNTHPEEWAAIYAAAPGVAVGGSVPFCEGHLSRGNEGGEECRGPLEQEMDSFNLVNEAREAEFQMSNKTLLPSNKAEMTVTAATASDSLSVCTSILYLFYYPNMVVSFFLSVMFVWFATIYY